MKLIKNLPKPEDRMSTNVVFVRNLPFDLPSKELENLFSSVGPVKKAFVITKKKQNDDVEHETINDHSRGFGFVEFRVPEDAERAIGEFNQHQFKERVLSVEMAKKKFRDAEHPRPPRKVKKEVVENVDDVPEPTQEVTIPEVIVQEEPDEPVIKQTDKIKKEKPLKKDNPKKDNSKKDVVVEIKDEPAEVTNVAVVTSVFDAPVKPIDPNSHTVLLSGIDASIDKKQLFKRVKKLGTVVTLIFPSPESTPTSISARIVYETPAIAQKAVSKLNNHTMKGGQFSAKIISTKSARLIVRNLSFKVTEEMLKKSFGAFGEIKSVSLPLNEGKVKGFGFIEFENEICASKAITALNGTKIEDRVIAVDWSLSKASYLLQQANLSEIKTEEPKTEEPKIEAQEKKEEKLKSVIKVEKEKKPRASDVGEGRTLFIRNLPAEATEQSLKTFFEQYGKIIYAKIVPDRGSAFIQVDAKDVAEFILQEAKPIVNTSNHSITATTSSAVVFMGRPLYITLALTREDANSKQEAKNVKEDRKRLHLAREGLILEGMPGAELLSKPDLEKRQRCWKDAKEKLKNPNYVVSAERLSVKNLPPLFTESELKSVFLEAASSYIEQNPSEFEKDVLSKKIFIKQATIAREDERVDKNGDKRSRGYGFVEFNSHDFALAALRAVNNNPKVFTAEKRPIVAFALDDQRKMLVRLRKMKTDSSNEKSVLGKKKSLPESTSENPNKKVKVNNSDASSTDKKVSSKKLKTDKESKNVSKDTTASDSIKSNKNESKKSTENKKVKNMFVESDNTEKAPKRKMKLDDLEEDVKQKKVRTNPTTNTSSERKFDSLVDEYKSKYFNSEKIRNQGKHWYESNE